MLDEGLVMSYARQFGALGVQAQRGMPYEASLAALVTDLRSRAHVVERSDPQWLPSRLRGWLNLQSHVQPGLAAFYRNAIQRLDQAADR